MNSKLNKFIVNSKLNKLEVNFTYIFQSLIYIRSVLAKTHDLDNKLGLDISGKKH